MKNYFKTGASPKENRGCDRWSSKIAAKKAAVLFSHCDIEQADLPEGFFTAKELKVTDSGWLAAMAACHNKEMHAKNGNTTPYSRDSGIDEMLNKSAEEDRQTSRRKPRQKTNNTCPLVLSSDPLENNPLDFKASGSKQFKDNIDRVGKELGRCVLDPEGLFTETSEEKFSSIMSQSQVQKTSKSDKFKQYLSSLTSGDKSVQDYDRLIAFWASDALTSQEASLVDAMMDVLSPSVKSTFLKEIKRVSSEEELVVFNNSWVHSFAVLSLQCMHGLKENNKDMFLTLKSSAGMIVSTAEGLSSCLQTTQGSIKTILKETKATTNDLNTATKDLIIELSKIHSLARPQLLSKPGPSRERTGSAASSSKSATVVK
ncbi:Hypothetical predicted protein, partial [Olea europaea subsp. europaea]